MLFEEIDRYYARNGEVVVDERAASEGAAWLQRVEEENAGDLTPERLAALERTTALDEQASPVAGRRFSRA